MRPILLVVLFVAGLASARWVRRSRSSLFRATGFVGEATNDISTAILQGYINDKRNIAFSPLGYSAILAILAEGARGETKKQLVSALHLPDDPNLTRKTYLYILDRLKDTHEYNKYNRPILKNYFYIYKKYTINENYKKILEDYYLTEVRTVEKYNWEEPHKGSIDNADNVTKSDSVTEIYENKPEEQNDDIPENMMPPKTTDEKLISFAIEDTPEIVDLEYKPAKNIKEKIKLVKTSEPEEEEEETMVAVEARNRARSLKVLQDKNDISASISVNSVGKKSNRDRLNDSDTDSNSLMIIFNGMYFRGSWKTPFKVVEPGTFYKSNNEKKQVPVMKTTGTFKTGTLPGLDSSAIELPYDGGRYALLLVVPGSRDGLTRLVADLPATPLSEIQDSLTEEELQVSLPTFYMETTTKAVSALAKFGVSSIFSREADLSGVSAVEGLFVQELVQHVTVRVDNTNSSATELTAANPSVEESLKNIPLNNVKAPRRFSVEHPFLFFIVDRLENFVLVGGKVVDPEEPMPSEI